MNLVDHTIVTSEEIPAQTAQMYDYLVAGNGVHLRAKRPGLSVLIPISTVEIRGLRHIQPYVNVAQKVPAEIVSEMMGLSLTAANSESAPQEILFHLLLGKDGWELHVPDQHATQYSCRPLDDSSGSTYVRALCECHSHHVMDPCFSPDDNEDEAGFRLYAVFGNIRRKPAVLVRVGVFGYWWEISADWVFEMPAGLQDQHQINEAVKKMGDDL